MNYHMSGNVVETHFLNEYAVAKLGKTDVKWFKLLIKKGMFTKETTSMSYMKPIFGNGQ